MRHSQMVRRQQVLLRGRSLVPKVALGVTAAAEYHLDCVLLAVEAEMAAWRRRAPAAGVVEAWGCLVLDVGLAVAVVWAGARAAVSWGRRVPGAGGAAAWRPVPGAWGCRALVDSVAASGSMVVEAEVAVASSLVAASVVVGAVAARVAGRSGWGEVGVAGGGLQEASLAYSWRPHAVGA